MRKITIFIIILDILALIGFFCFYGPIKSIRTWWINTAMHTMSHKYFAYIFYTDEMIQQTMNENYYIPLTEEVDLDSIVIDTAPKYTYENEYDEQILVRDEGNDDYKLIDVKVGKHDAFLVAIYDPSRISVVTKEQLGKGAFGENMVSMSKRTNSKVCINGGKFQQDSQGLSSDFPIGYIIKDSEIVWATDPTWRSELIGFNKDNKLVLTVASGSEALEMGIRDAVEFGPYFIINGKAMQTVGNGGSGNAPRVAIAQRKDGIVLFLVTNTKYFYGGPTFQEVIETLQKYGAYNAANLDGGSSATLVVENKLINTPRDIKTGVINPRGTVSGFCFK